jgi:SpoVK/Ycf46/Vps4 family AAA+-type ATPase
MSSRRMVVSIDASRDDSFGLVSPEFLHRVIAPHFAEVPPVVALELTATDDGPGASRRKYIGVATGNPSAPGNKLLLSPLFAADLQLREGDLLAVTVLVGSPVADKVLVSPASVDDSEIVEHNAVQIESTLLRKLRVVQVGMKITVVVHRGLRAQLVVDRIDLAGSGLHERCAMLCEGTELHVATRSRANPTASRPPSEAFLRMLPADATAAAVGDVLVNKDLANRMNWTEGMAVGIVNMAEMAWMESFKLPPSMLRSGAAKGHVRIAVEAPVSSTAISVGGFSASPTTAYVFPDPPPAVAKEMSALSAAQEALISSPFRRNLFRVSMEDLRDVHGDVILKLVNYLGVVARAPPQHFFFSHNVLLTGAKGGGKSTAALCVAQTLSCVHVTYFDCAASGKDKTTLASLQRTFLEAALCAPSIVVLDNLEAMAPAQQEGNNAAMSAATEASLEAFLTTLSSCTDTQVSRGPVIVMATSTALEAVHEKVRGAFCFALIEALPALSVTSRAALLRQQLAANLPSGMLPDDGLVKAAAKLTDNYSPFDIVQLTKRLASSLDRETGMVPKKQLAAVVAGFTPLAHSGTQFLSSTDRKTWADIGGMSEAKKALHDALVLPLKHPKLFAKLPLKTRSGVLLFGPPGCGKSYVVASAVAAEGLHCILVNGPEIFGKYIGQSEQKVREIFEKAQAAAPSVVFFDEFESVAPQRGHDNTGVTDRVVNQLLCYLDGVEARKNVFVVAASSRPDLIDAALLRPGRLDKAVLCPMPCAADRREILDVHLRAVGASASLSADEMAELVDHTDQWTAADLAGLVASANLLVIQENIDMSKELAALNLGGNAGAARDGLRDTAASSSLVLASGSASKNLLEKVREAVAGSHDASPRPAPRAGVAATPNPTRRVLSMTHVRQALLTTRRSTTDGDLLKQQALYDRFMKSREPGGGGAVPQPGTKVTFA